MQDPWIRKSLWRRKWQPTPVILPGEFHGQRSLAGYSPWGCKSQAWLSNYHSSHTTSLLSRRVPISFLPACWVSASIPYPCHLGLKMISNYLFENNIFSYLYLVFAFFFSGNFSFMFSISLIDEFLLIYLKGQFYILMIITFHICYKDFLLKYHLSFLLHMCILNQQEFLTFRLWIFVKSF